VIPRALRDLAHATRYELVHVVGDATLQNHCVPASRLLAVRAQDAGFDVTVVGGWARTHRGPTGHAWCQFGDAILDLTAQQFWRVSPLYIVRRPHRRYSPITLDHDWVRFEDARPDQTRRVLRRFGVSP
jgi:hypothetical protein